MKTVRVLLGRMIGAPHHKDVVEVLVGNNVQMEGDIEMPLVVCSVGRDDEVVVGGVPVDSD